MDKYICTPLTEEKVRDLKSGDYVYLSGTIYTARDAAHKRMTECLEKGVQIYLSIFILFSAHNAKFNANIFCEQLTNYMNYVKIS